MPCSKVFHDAFPRSCCRSIYSLSCCWTSASTFRGNGIFLASSWFLLRRVSSCHGILGSRSKDSSHARPKLLGTEWANRVRQFSSRQRSIMNCSEPVAVLQSGNRSRRRRLEKVVCCALLARWDPSFFRVGECITHSKRQASSTMLARTSRS